MKVVKLTKKAQDIVNQIMSSDAIEITHGPVYHLVYGGDITLNSEGLDCFVDVDGDSGEMQITNETLNEAVIVDGVIQIDSDHIKDNQFGDMTITLYKLSKIAAL
jgi:hypothetical protein